MSAVDPDTDVVVVGSGAAGGMAAHVLTHAGVRVTMLEAGRDYDPVTETPMFNLPGEAPLNGASTPDKEFGYYDATVGGGWEVPGEPYTVAEGSAFRWWRARMLGGRTNHWGRLSLRFGPYDFKGRSRDGLGVDWPIAYEDLAPYYDRVERLIGVFGEAEGLENSPDSPPGVLLPPPAFRAFEEWMRLSLRRIAGIPVVPAHMAILTRPHGDRPACLFATDCLRGCSIGANFQSTTVLLPPARATGKLEVRTRAKVVEVLVDGRGRARGVLYINTATGDLHRVTAHRVVLAASTCETARILLLSRSKSHPDGLANTSGEVGRNLMDTVAAGVSAQVPQLEDLPPFHDEGVTLFHAYSPWWGYDRQRRGEIPFPRGYHFEYWGGRRLPEFDDMLLLAGLTGARGSRLHAEMRRYFGSIVWMTGRGEMIPNAGTFCDLDPLTTDRWGYPALRFHWKWGPLELAQADHMRRTAADAFRAMGARVLTDVDQPLDKAIRVGGSVIHEAGTCRTGDKAATSVVDPWLQAWDVPGLHIVDAATFPSMPDKNPTLTILAQAWRAMDALIQGLRPGGG